MALISIVVPVFNNEGSLEATFEQIHGLFAGPLQRHSFEVVFVNDGSKDRSWEKLRKLKASFPTQIRLIRLTRNFGQNAAMMAGSRHTRGDCLINVSADLQDPIEVMAQFVEKWEQGFRIVAATRSGREDSWARKLPSMILYSFVHLSIPQYPEKGFDYYLIGREVVDVINSYRDRNTFITYNILETGYEPCFIPYVRRKRPHGRSGYTFLKLLKNAVDTVINASYVPIRMMTAAGTITAFASFAYAARVFYARIVHNIVISGYAPIVILILFFAGINMLMLGLIGEYLWRTYDHTKMRPEYFIQEKLD